MVPEAPSVRRAVRWGSSKVVGDVEVPRGDERHLCLGV
jgi:hypothetical protein